MKKRGISLIVLIIAIIVVIILAAVVILTLSKNNPIESAKEARFKEDVRTFQDELAMTVSKQYTAVGGHRDTKISTSDFDEIKEYIKSFSEKYKDKFVIEDDELKYTDKIDKSEESYLVSLNVKKEKGYIKDGLLLYLDGINNTRSGHSDTTTVWEDLSGNNNDFNLNNFDGTSASGWQEKSLKFDGVNDYLVSKDIFDFNNTDALTIQFVDLNGELYSNDSSSTQMIFESSTNFGYKANSFMVDLNEVGNKKINFATHFNYFSVQYDSEGINPNESMMYTLNFNAKNGFNNYFTMYKNLDLRNLNKLYENNMDNFIFNSYPFYIGSRAGTSLFCKMNFASVRIYNRVLTEEEIKHNYEVDKARFGI